METKQIRKLKVGSKTWQNNLLETLIYEAPELHLCQHCHRVNRAGYCCDYCGSDEPGEFEIDPKEWI